MPNEARYNRWTKVKEPLQIIGESHVVPNGSALSVRPGAPENEFYLAEVPLKDPNNRIRCYEAGSATTAALPDVTQIYEGAPTTNFGTSTYFQTGRDASGLAYRYMGLLRLATLSGLPTVVTNVKLKVFLVNTSGFAGYPGKRQIGVHAIEGTWTETGVKWNNQPAHNLIAAASFDVTLTGWYYVDITDIYRGWISSGNNYGMLLKDGNDPDYNNHRTFSSESAGGQAPVLIIDEPGDIRSEVATETPPGPGQFGVDYQTGLVRCHDDDVGVTLYFDYPGLGQLVKG